MRARPKYQVFISSTYGDLREEREAVTWAVLTARHIPAGMENFTATDDRGWQTIKSVIDRSDYYVLILAGRYGSLDKDGKSWTEKEYEYAVSRGIPILAFLRSKKTITADKVDEDSKLKSKLEKFKSIVRDKHLTCEWETKDDLKGHVTNALRNHIIDDEDGGHGRPGWYRGDEVPSPDALDEFARISSENGRLRLENESLKSGIEQQPRLTLVDQAEQPLPQTIVTKKALKVYSPAQTSLEEMNNERYGGARLALNIVQIVQLGVLNTSNAVIEHVTIDLSLAPIIGFDCGWDGNNLVNSGGKLSNSTIAPEYQNRYPELIRLINPDHISIRLRIPRVPAGGTEYLPDLLVLGIVDKDRTYFNLNYKIVGSVGGVATGAIHYEVIFEGSTILDRDAEWGDQRELEKGRGSIIPADMFLKKK